MAKKDPKTWVVLNDLQIPFQDDQALGLALDFVDDLRPDGVVLNGDVCDVYSLSSFDKSPLTSASLDLEIRLSQNLMHRLKGVKEKVWIGGNHEARLTRHLWSNPGLWRDLDSASRKRVAEALDFPQVFGLSDFGFKWLPYGGTFKLGKLLVTHGSIVSKHSGQTGRAHLDKYGCSVLIGHTHRGGVTYKTDLTGVHAAYENFCLCRLDPEYVQHPNWQQGLSVVHVGKSGMFNVQQVPILSPGRQLFYGSEHWEAA